MLLEPQNASGEQLYGRKVLDGILTCLRLREINVADATIKRRNRDTGQDENIRVAVFPELMNKPIGVVLVREEYQAKDGSLKWKNILAAPYEASSGRLPVECLDNKPAEGLERIVASLRDRPMKAGARRQQSAPQGGGARQPDAGAGFENMDNDIPF